MILLQELRSLVYSWCKGTLLTGIEIDLPLLLRRHLDPS